MECHVSLLAIHRTAVLLTVERKRIKLSNSGESHHDAWLQAHPWRSADWLSIQLKEGFDIHHLDGNNLNNDPKNLVLIECSDHLMLHSGGRTMGRLRPSGRRKTVKLIETVPLPTDFWARLEIVKQKVLQNPRRRRRRI